MLDKTFVVVGLNPWNDEAPSEVEHIIRNLAQGNRVLYVNPPSDISSLLARSKSNRLSKADGDISDNQAIRNIDTQLWVLDAPLILTPLNDRLADRIFDFINRYNNRRLARAIMWAARNIGLAPQWLINISSVFNGYYLPEMLGVDKAIYMRCEKGMLYNEMCGHQLRLEPKIAHKYDAVVACSELMCSDLRSQNCNTFNIGQGFDFENYNLAQSYDMPEDMTNVPAPVIGYIGNLDDDAFSAAMVERLACAVPWASILLIDTNYSAARNKALPLSKNIYMLSKSHETDFAGYIAHFDICINPQSSVSLADIYYPENIMRYLSMGKIVVSSSSLAVECLRYNILIADNGEEFIDYIKLALKHGSNIQLEKRFSDFAALHSWEMVSDRLYGVLEMIIEPEYSVEKQQSVEKTVLS